MWHSLTRLGLITQKNETSEMHCGKTNINLLLNNPDFKTQQNKLIPNIKHMSILHMHHNLTDTHVDNMVSLKSTELQPIKLGNVCF